jgi:glycogen synthase
MTTDPFSSGRSLPAASMSKPDHSPAALTIAPGRSPARGPAPRRVLMTTDPFGGVWTYALELARGLVASDVEVIVASLGGPVSPAQRAAFDRLGERATLYVDHRRLEWMDKPWDDVAATGEWLLRLEREHRPDLVHLNGYAHAALPFRAPVLVVAHSCVCSWWRAVHRCYPPAEFDRYHEVAARGLRAARMVIAPTQAMLSALVAQYGELPSARVIPHGRSPLPSPGLLRENVVLGVGRLWDQAKNLRALADVAPSLPYPWTVRLAGSPRSPQGEEVSLPGVELLGQLPDHSLGAHYDRATIFALPALYEPFGISVLEAAHAGCALVLGDIRNLRENWDGAAIFVAPDDRVALRAAIVELIKRPTVRRGLVTEARARAAALTPGRMCAAYLHVYSSLLATRTDRAGAAAISDAPAAEPRHADSAATPEPSANPVSSLPAPQPVLV